MTDCVVPRGGRHETVCLRYLTRVCTSKGADPHLSIEVAFLLTRTEHSPEGSHRRCPFCGCRSSERPNRHFTKTFGHQTRTLSLTANIRSENSSFDPSSSLDSSPLFDPSSSLDSSSSGSLVAGTLSSSPTQAAVLNAAFMLTWATSYSSSASNTRSAFFFFRTCVFK